MADVNSTQNPTHIDDVVCYFRCCSETFGHLAALLAAIKKQIPEDSDAYKIVSAAAYISLDYENMSGYWKDEIKINGVKGHYLEQPDGELKAVILELAETNHG
jgi:hypothetical protein